MGGQGGPLARAESLLAQAMAPLAAQQYAPALAAFVAVLRHHRQELARGNHMPDAAGFAEFRGFCSRFLDGWIRLVQAPGFSPLRDPSLPALLAEFGDFYLVADAVGDHRLDHALAAQVQRFNASRQADDFLKILLLWTPESRAGFSPFAHLQTTPAVVIAHALATVAALVNCSEQANAARNAAIALLGSGQMDAATLAPFVPTAVFPSAWFRCSYADAPRKHQLKRVLNAAIVQSLAAAAPRAPAPLPLAVRQAAGDARPRLVVPVEWAFSEGGAMYRCYAPVLRDLRRHFFTIGLGERRIADPSLAALFDQYADFEALCPGGELDTNTLAAAIRAMNPSLLFYPSVGMLRTVIQLANLRLAPVQAMSVGHPASSMSPAMDYVLTEAAYVGSPDIFSERAILASRGAMTFGAPPIAPPAEEMPAADRIDIAIPAVGHKVGWPFLAALREVERHARRPVTFHFFTGLAGTSFIEMALQIHRVLPSAKLYAMTSYDRYIDAIRRCHLHAASFPFGGTNSVIDSLRLGLPVVALEGNEVHERVDAAFLRQIGMDELVASTAAGYIDILAALVDDPEHLRALRRRILGEGRVASELMGRGRPEEFSDALAALVQSTATEASR